MQCAAREEEEEEEEEEQRFLICDMALISLAAVGVVGVGVGLYSIRPRDPVFEVQSITLSGFNVRFTTESTIPMAVVDVSLTLFIKVINPNVTPIQFSSTVMDIYYKGTLLGQAQVCISCLLALFLQGGDIVMHPKNGPRFGIPTFQGHVESTTETFPAYN